MKTFFSSLLLVAVLIGTASHVQAVVTVQNVVVESFNGGGTFSSGGDVILTNLENPGWSTDIFDDPNTLTTITQNIPNGSVDFFNTGNLHHSNLSSQFRGGSTDPNNPWTQRVMLNNMVFDGDVNSAGVALLTFGAIGGPADQGFSVTLVDFAPDPAHPIPDPENTWQFSFVDQGFPVEAPFFPAGIDILLEFRQYNDTVEFWYDQDTTDNGGVPDPNMVFSFLQFFGNTPAKDASRNAFLIPTATMTDPNDPSVVSFELDSYFLSATAECTEGDYTCNDVVDGSDFFRWQQNVGTTGTATFFDGDGNLDTNVNGIDLEIWELNYGDVHPLVAPLAAVPEPTTGALLLGILTAAGAWRRRR